MKRNVCLLIGLAMVLIATTGCNLGKVLAVGQHVGVAAQVKGLTSRTDISGAKIKTQVPPAEYITNNQGRADLYVEQGQHVLNFDVIYWTLPGEHGRQERTKSFQVGLAIDPVHVICWVQDNPYLPGAASASEPTGETVKVDVSYNGVDWISHTFTGVTDTTLIVIEKPE